MKKYEIGYGKPPPESRFKPGNNANPNGRPKRKPLLIADVIAGFLDAPTQYSERGQIKRDLEK